VRALFGGGALDQGERYWQTQEFWPEAYDDPDLATQ